MYYKLSYCHIVLPVCVSELCDSFILCKLCNAYHHSKCIYMIKNEQDDDHPMKIR